MAIIKVTKNYGLPCMGWEVIVKDDNSPTGFMQYSSKDHKWSEVPHGILVVIWWHEYHIKPEEEGPTCRKKTLSGGLDYYAYIDPKTWGDSNDFEEVKDYDFKRGIWAPDDQFERIYRRCFEKLDMD